MSNLYPTPTRLDLLAEIQAGRVLLAGIPGTGIRRRIGAVLVDSGGAFVRVVDAAVREVEQAGWAQRPDRTAVWCLTDTGTAVLDAHRAGAR